MSCSTSRNSPRSWPGAEALARAGDHDCADVFGRRLFQRVVERGVHRRREGVVGLGPVERDRQDRSDQAGLDLRHEAQPIARLLSLAHGSVEADFARRARAGRGAARRLLARGHGGGAAARAVGREPARVAPRGTRTPNGRRRQRRRHHAGRLPAHLRPRRRGRRARRGLVRRRPGADGRGGRRRPALGPRGAADRAERARRSGTRGRGAAPGRPARGRDRQPERFRRVGHRGGRLRARPLAADPLGIGDADRRERDPDRRRPQPGELGRRARRR